MTSWSAILTQSYLLIDKVYVGGHNGNSSDDPLWHLTDEERRLATGKARVNFNGFSLGDMSYS
jgi:hypothetical protein